MRSSRLLVSWTVVVCVLAPMRATAQDPAAAPPPADARAPGDTSFLVENVTRVEVWRFFEPFENGGTQPNYTFFGNRSTLGARYDGQRWSLNGAIQYVRAEGLPRGAIGPGLLGNGGAYFFQAAGTFSYQFYLRALSAAYSSASHRVTLEVGRLSLAPGPGPASDPTEDLARERLSARLLGDMEGSLYERAWDGGRARLALGDWEWTATAALPTQGTFEESANLPMERLQIASLEATARPGAVVDRTRLQLFAAGYRDRREVRARPDNSGLTATTADVSIVTLGVSAAGVYPRDRGSWDLAAWSAGQFGDWYGQPHRAASALVEGGYRWTAARGRPVARVGAVWASGDGEPVDDRHGTFFPMLPSGDRYVRSNVYALMNVLDVWGETRLEPRRDLHLQAGVHWAALASTRDRWYAGSGATERRGNYFGYLGRNTRGAGTLGTTVEGEAAWRPIRWWTLLGYFAHMAGGEAVGAVFAGRRVFTASFASILSF